MEWPPNPSQTILVTKKWWLNTPELKNWQNGHFEGFYPKFDQFCSWSNLPGSLRLIWSLRPKIHTITLKNWYKSQKTNKTQLDWPMIRNGQFDPLSFLTKTRFMDLSWVFKTKCVNFMALKWSFKFDRLDFDPKWPYQV